LANILIESSHRPCFEVEAWTLIAWGGKPEGQAMSADESITRWIDTLKAGDPDAARRIWDAYFRRLVALARGKLRGVSRRAADEEDVALSAFDSFCRGAERGRFPSLLDRDDLWQLLFVITVRKAYDLARHEGRVRRGAGHVRTLSDLAVLGVDAILSTEPSPELAAQVAEECQRLLNLLANDSLRAVALAKMAGDTHEEIAARLGCVRYTVDRKLQMIRRIWAGEGQG
jgi:DNA-directed RNA polymerase specialized sigma24 family protein